MLIAGGVAAVIAAALRRGGGPPRIAWPENLAHRGASVRAPENTLEAFRLAVNSGAGGLELDVHMTRDGYIAVIHDNTVDRTTDGSGPVREMPLKQLRALDAGYRFSPDGGSTYPYRERGVRVPLLAEVFREFPDSCVNLEMKEAQPGVEETVLRTIREAGAGGRALVASAKHRVIRRFREVSGGSVPTAASRREIQVFYLLSLLRLERLLRPGYEALQVPASYRGTRVVTPRFVAAAHTLGVRVDVWTIDDPAEMRRLLALGVDGIMTNRPEVLEEVLRERRGQGRQAADHRHAG